jgi:hypothetical protein
VSPPSRFGDPLHHLDLAHPLTPFSLPDSQPDTDAMDLCKPPLPDAAPAGSLYHSRKKSTPPILLPSSPQQPAPRPLFPSARRPPEQLVVDLQTRRTSPSMCFPGEPSPLCLLPLDPDLVARVRSLTRRGILRSGAFLSLLIRRPSIAIRPNRYQPVPWCHVTCPSQPRSDSVKTQIQTRFQIPVSVLIL